MSQILKFIALTALVTPPSIAATETLASQGPGVASGTAAAFTQTAIAILVYGLCAVIVSAGLIGALRKR